MSKAAIIRLRTTSQQRVQAITAADVAALFDRCWWRTPSRRYQLRAERFAEAQGWSASWQWERVDIDDPAAAPLAEPGDADVDGELAAAEARPMRLSRPARRAAVARLARAGCSARQTASRLRCSVRTVERDRALAAELGELEVAV